MEVSLQKTLIFILFIGIGLILKFKFRNKDEVAGIKKIILNLALPATIFIALLGIDLKPGLFLLPFFALFLNALLFFIFPYLLPSCGFRRHTSEFRTAHLLIPSLAPGLSAFPFILEYLGDDALAKAAMADLGNKVFVLLILYMVAMNWHYKVTHQVSISKGSRIKELLKSLIYEPVNLFIVIALVLLSMGLDTASLPGVISATLHRLSLLMTPLVLLFIGLAVSIKRNQFSKILSLLMLRAGIVLFLSCLFIWLGGINTGTNRLLILAFALSACSFWPYAHIAVVGLKESEKETGEEKTFSGRMAVNILALSFPLSIILILGIFTIGESVTALSILLPIAAFLCLCGVLPNILKRKNTLEIPEPVEKLTPEFENSRAEKV